MDVIEATAAANTLAEYKRCFSRGDLLTFTNTNKELRIIFKTINKDSRFLSIYEGTNQEKIFIPKKALYYWYVALNIKLARAQIARLDEHKLALLISSLRIDDQWDIPPDDYVEFGRTFSLIKPAWKPHEYVFPLAYLISLLQSWSLEIAKDVLNSLVNEVQIDIPSEKMLFNAVEEGLAALTPRERRVLKKRNGLLNDMKMTLEQIGNELNVTRERIRQIEEKVWRKLRHRSYRHRFIRALLFAIIHREGSFLVSMGSPLETLLSFIAKSNGIPLFVLPNTRVILIGTAEFDMEWLQSVDPLNVDPNTLATQIESNCKVPLMAKDTILIAERIYANIRKRFTKVQRVYLVLKHINRPAHSSEIADVYNYLFPQDPSTERNIHATLTREQHGVVWIGVRSTYALKEWGYEHPSATLFETIAKIVNSKFAETDKPVPFAVIAAEIGKYRRVVRPASIAIAAHYNPALKCVYGDYFIPSKDKRDEKEVTAKELDRILREFEGRYKRQSMNEQMTYDKALEIAKEALRVYQKAETKADIEKIFIKYGRQGIGYRPLCRMFYSKKPPEDVVGAYTKK